MSKSDGDGIFTCRNICWIIAAILGILVLWLCVSRFDLNFVLSLILGLIVAGAAAYFLPGWLCEDHGLSAEDGMSGAGRTADTGAAAAPPPAASGIPSAAAMPVASADPLTADPTEVTAVVPEAEETADEGPSAPAGDDAAQDTGSATGAPAAPAGLSGARGGQADDLKRIKGVGPALEKLLNEKMGIYHFDQIAAWTAEELAWVDDNLLKFKGRASRDKWIEQAKLLAAGGETEFSKRVSKGDVY